MRRVYPRDIFPTVWDLMSQWADAGIIWSIELVYDELEVQDDEVLDWAKKRKEIFVPLDEQIQNHASRVLAKWPNLIDLKKRKSGADPFVIGHALQHKTAVVTEEKPVGPGAKHVKIPNARRDFSVNCINLLELLRQLRASL
jgi:hypothetical protein